MKYFLVGVANVYFYATGTEDLIFTSQTMTDTAIDVKIANSKINGGWGNQLQYIYFHTPELDLTLTDCQYNLGMIAATTGSDINIGANIWETETVTLGTGGTGTVSQTPLLTPDMATGAIFGWVTDASNNTTKVTFTGSNFTLAGGTQNEQVTVRYYTANNAAESMEIEANFIPKKGRLVLDVQLGASNSGNAEDSAIIGNVQIEIPEAQLDGTANIALKSSGVSTTPLKAVALAHNQNNKSIYGTITNNILDANWYDNVQFLAIVNNEISLSASNTSATLDVRAIPSSGNAFKVPNYSDLTFTSSDVTKCTVNSAGLITKVGTTGSATITVAITNKNTVTAVAEVTILS